MQKNGNKGSSGESSKYSEIKMQPISDSKKQSGLFDKKIVFFKLDSTQYNQALNDSTLLQPATL